MPIEFLLQPTGSSSDNLFKLTMSYDGSGRRISKTRWVKKVGAQEWEKELVTHYTGIGTEIRENYAGPAKQTKVVVNMPQGLGRYKVADASQPADDNASRMFEWYLKNHLGSTMLVYGTESSTDPNTADIGNTKAAYDYRSFGEQVTLSQPSDKVTENFTGKEHDDEIALDYFGARYLDPMLGMWISVDPKRQFASPYLYAGNGYNPVNGVDPDGNAAYLYATILKSGGYSFYAEDDKGSKPISGSFNTHTMNFNQLGAGSYTITPRPYLKNVGFGTWLLNFVRGRDVNEHAGRPSISNTDDWNTVRNADGSLTKGAQVHPGRNGTAGGVSRACLVTDLQTYNLLKEMFDNNYNDGGVFLEILPEGASLPQVEAGPAESNVYEPNGFAKAGDPLDITYTP